MSLLSGLVLGGMFIGVLLLAGATSLPEVLTTISAVYQGVPDLAAGNLLGSNIFNMLLLAILDLSHRKERILRKAALKHALIGQPGNFHDRAGGIFYTRRYPGQNWLGGAGQHIYYVSLFCRCAPDPNQPTAWQCARSRSIPEGTPSLRKGLLGFGLAAVALMIVTPWMVSTSAEIAVITGLGATFIGTTLVAVVTSLPELVTTFAALRLGADDMAIGNLFGSNLFNMFALGLTDLFYLQGRFLGVIDPAFLLVGMLGLLMTGLGLIGNLARLERRVLFVELDALALIVLYFGGLWLLYSRGVAP